MLQDDRKAEGDLAKKKAAFLLKQQKKAEEARLRRQQLEAESELKRDEARYPVVQTQNQIVIILQSFKENLGFC